MTIHRSLIAALALLMLLLAATATTAAEAPALRHVQPLLAAAPVLEVESVRGVRYRGTLADATDSGLTLTNGGRRRTFAWDEVRSLRRRVRSTGPGLRRGALVGGVALAGLGALSGGLVATDDDGAVPGFVVAMGALGLIGGGAVGAVLGESVPRWVGLAGRPGGEAAPAPGWERAERPLGGVALGAGYAAALGGDDAGGAAGRLLLSAFHGVISHGAEVALLSPGTASPRTVEVPGVELRPDDHRHVLLLGWRGEYAPRLMSGADWTPFLSLGMGAYIWRESFLGYSLGAGLRAGRSDARRGALLEVRRHDNVQRLIETDPAFWSATAAVTWAW